MYTHAHTCTTSISIRYLIVRWKNLCPAVHSNEKIAHSISLHFLSNTFYLFANIVWGFPNNTWLWFTVGNKIKETILALL